MSEFFGRAYADSLLTGTPWTMSVGDFFVKGPEGTLVGPFNEAEANAKLRETLLASDEGTGFVLKVVRGSKVVKTVEEL